MLRLILAFDQDTRRQLSFVKLDHLGEVPSQIERSLGRLHLDFLPLLFLHFLISLTVLSLLLQLRLPRRERAELMDLGHELRGFLPNHADDFQGLSG